MVDFEQGCLSFDKNICSALMVCRHLMIVASVSNLNPSQTINAKLNY